MCKKLNFDFRGIILMSDAIITGAVAIIVCMINNFFQTSKLQSIISYRLEQLEKKVEKHNNVIERTYECESRLSVIEEKISVANHRIEDLEDDVK